MGKLLGILAFLFPVVAFAQIEGYGKDATGGAAFGTCIVSSTATLDACLDNAGGGRRIYFSVPSVTVNKTQHIKSNTTIDGCANGQNGVTLLMPADRARGLVIEAPATNVVIQCLRFQTGGKQPGSSTEFDQLGIDGDGALVSRVVVDRCTFTGATDGALDITGTVSDVTVQRSLFYGNAITQLIKYDTRQRISLHHNVYTANGERNPQIKGAARQIDFVSNVVYDQTVFSDGVGNTYSPYGTLVWSTGSGSDSPGNVLANLRSNFYGGGSSDLELEVDSGASLAGVYVATDNVCEGGCPTSPAGAPNAVPAAYVVTVTRPDQMNVLMLPTVGSPNRTAADSARINAVSAALPGPGPTPTPSPSPTPTPSPSPTPTPGPTPCPTCPVPVITPTTSCTAPILQPDGSRLVTCTTTVRVR